VGSAEPHSAFGTYKVPLAIVSYFCSLVPKVFPPFHSLPNYCWLTYGCLRVCSSGKSAFRLWSLILILPVMNENV